MEKKDQIYQYIVSEVASKGSAPTIREIGQRFGISSTNGVRYFLERLSSEGLIRRQHRKARGIQVMERNKVEHRASGSTIPLLGRVPAGKPLFSSEFIEDEILLDSSIAKGEKIFALRVSGDSMIDAGINDGDLAVVQQNPAPRSGEIVVAMIDDEVTLKRFVKRTGSIQLIPENPEYPVIDLSSLKDRHIRIIGSVLAIIRKY
jgi:repressor LexA